VRDALFDNRGSRASDVSVLSLGKGSDDFGLGIGIDMGMEASVLCDSLLGPFTVRAGTEETGLDFGVGIGMGVAASATFRASDGSRFRGLSGVACDVSTRRSTAGSLAEGGVVTLLGGG
jgi:hypothetical protein